MVNEKQDMVQTKPRQTEDRNYISLLHDFCVTEDVLIIPDFVSVFKTEPREINTAKKSGDSLFAENVKNVENDIESLKNSDFLRPPRILIVHEKTENAENPTEILCKNMYLEFSLVQAIGRSLSYFSTLGSLRIEDCCISKELAEGLARILTEGPGRQIFDLSLDGNPGVHQVLPLFLSLPNGLKIISLQRCELDDDGIEIFAKSLSYADERQPMLLVLNLGLNRIGNLGAGHLAHALRTNRTLRSLSLEGNQIGDKGAAFVAQVIQRFQLTDEEIRIRRRRIFDKIFKTLNVSTKASEISTEKKDVDIETSKTSRKFSGFIQSRRMREPDGKLCSASRDKRTKIDPKLSSRLNAGIKFEGNKRCLEKNMGNSSQRNFANLSVQQIDSGKPDLHPFVNESYANEGQIWCKGCWSLFRINLAYNLLSENAVKKFLDAMDDQYEIFKSSRKGLSQIKILPGNFIDENSREVEKLRLMTLQRESMGDP